MKRKSEYKSYNFEIKRFNIDNQKNIIETYFPTDFIDQELKFNDESRQLYFFHRKPLVLEDIEKHFVDQNTTPKKILKEAKLFFSQ